MWPEELVRRACQKIAAKLLNVDRKMGNALHCVDVDDRADAVCQPDHSPDVVDRAGGVAGQTERHQSGAAVDLAFEMIVVERTVLGVDVGKANHHSSLLQR